MSPAATREVLVITLTGLARDADIDRIGLDLRQFRPRNDSFPGEVFLELAVEALELAGFTREDPLHYEDLWKRLLPEVEIRGRVGHQKSEYVIMCPPALRGGLKPDLLNELYWWTADDYWQFAFYAFVVYTRAASERTASSVNDICHRLAQLHDIDLDTTSPPVS